MKTIATTDSKAGTFTITRGIWSATYPIAELPRWIEFYRLQRERFPAQASIYGESLRALTELRDSL